MCVCGGGGWMGMVSGLQATHLSMHAYRYDLGLYDVVTDDMMWLFGLLSAHGLHSTRLSLAAPR